ncbi:hypothetical protein WFA24289_01057 [Periweissella fabaria]|uniref:Uncharacterized protein n=1 Tax=Periweissella fabaria TaxID=546157 RepID=A0ABM8Z5Z0_9LACO|nr:hypothetical protein WFA24289_01057 [Periweissella fabaria]
MAQKSLFFLVDFFIIRHQKYETTEFTKVNGKYWYQGGFNILAVGTWIIGVIIFFGISMIPAIKDSIGATFITMIITGMIYFLVAKIGQNKKA